MFIDEYKERWGGVEPICRVLSEHGWQIAHAMILAFAAEGKFGEPRTDDS